MLRLKLFHINDTHSQIDPSPMPIRVQHLGLDRIEVAAGGYPAIHAFVKRERALARKAGIPTLFLHAGDCFEGSLYFTLFKGRADVALLNRMKIDAMTVGNHEFDRGDCLLAKFIRRARFDVLSSNLEFRNGCSTESPLARAGAKLVKHDREVRNSYVVKDVGDKAVAIFGLSLPTMHDIASPSEALSFLDPAGVARRVVADAGERGIDTVILLSHLGIEGDRALAREVAGISLIVGGHTHLLQGDFSGLGLGGNGHYGEVVESTHILHAGHNALAVGVCDIRFDDRGKVASIEGGNKLLLSRRDSKGYKRLVAPRAAGSDNLYTYLSARSDIAFVEPDRAFEAFVRRRFGAQVARLSREAVATFPKEYGYQRIGRCGDPDSACTLVADSMAAWARGHKESGAIALINAGAVRRGIARGPLTAKDVYGSLLPFPIALCRIELKGAHIVEAIEGAVANALFNPAGTGSFPYASNLTYEYDAGEGRVRIHSVRTRSGGHEPFTPLDPSRSYRVFVSSYMAKGKEGYGALLNGEQHLHDVLVADAFADYLRSGEWHERARG